MATQDSGAKNKNSHSNTADMIVKLTVVGLISLFAFAVGIWLGKNVSDNNHKVAQMEPKSGHKEAGETHEKSETVAKSEKSESESEAISDQEISKLAEEFVSEDENGVPNRAVASEEHGEKEHGEKAEATEGEKSGHDKKVAKKTKTEIHPDEEEKTDLVANEAKVELKKEGLSKAATIAAAGKFTVQVASYSKEDEADGMKTSLAKKGLTNAFYTKADIKGQTWYRVNVGMFSTAKEATAYKNDLLSRAKVGSAIVTKIK